MIWFWDIWSRVTGSLNSALLLKQLQSAGQPSSRLVNIKRLSSSVLARSIHHTAVQTYFKGPKTSETVNFKKIRTEREGEGKWEWEIEKEKEKEKESVRERERKWERERGGRERVREKEKEKTSLFRACLKSLCLMLLEFDRSRQVH